MHILKHEGMNLVRLVEGQEKTTPDFIFNLKCLSQMQQTKNVLTFFFLKIWIKTPSNYFLKKEKNLFLVIALPSLACYLSSPNCFIKFNNTQALMSDPLFISIGC